jgi:hypothetical protein
MTTECRRGNVFRLLSRRSGFVTDGDLVVFCDGGAGGRGGVGQCLPADDDRRDLVASGVDYVTRRGRKIGPVALIRHHNGRRETPTASDGGERWIGDRQYHRLHVGVAGVGPAQISVTKSLPVRWNRVVDPCRHHIERTDITFNTDELHGIAVGRLDHEIPRASIGGDIDH